MDYLIFLGGVILGTIISMILHRYKTCYGYFKIEPYEDGEDGIYTINMRIPKSQDLSNAKQIILHKDDSQK